MATKVYKTPVGRASYAFVYEARAFKKGDQKGPSTDTDKANPAKYSLTMIFQPKDDISAIKKAIDEAIAERWGDKRPPAAKFKNPLHKCEDSEDENGNLGQGMVRGGHYCRFSSLRKPQIVDINGDAILADSEEFYSGCMCRCSFRAGAFHHPEGGKGVSLYLNNIQKVKDAGRLDGSTTADQDFGRDDMSSYQDDEVDEEILR